ncbi:type II secretion system protein GspN [Desulfovibrio sp. JC022]|uniref:type II secretion system protein GspN n=1 Tax=Desulfovibrio sp. JC022 TaxID=2593642 RepID=UPI0013D8BF34|nr:type II secretion system protein GspN [Desulfovibrio sp. JC022]NDV24918.1 type II secretion system protein GspN [Desulfovibrio sp. JC022]
MGLSLAYLKDKFSFTLPLGGGRSRRKAPLKIGRRHTYYLIYGLFVFTIVFCGNYFSSRIEPMIRAGLQNQPLYDIQISSIDPILFPPQLDLSAINVKEKKTGRQLVQIDRLLVQPDLLGLLKTRLALKLEGSVYGALLEGGVGSGTLFNFNAFLVDLDCDNLSLNKIPEINALNLGLEGTGRLSLDLQGDAGDPKTFRGSLVLGLQKTAFKGIAPLFVAPRVQMDSLSGSVHLENLVLNLDQMELRGKSMSGNMSGKIGLDPANINNSMLELKGQVKADLALFNQQVIVQKKAIALMQAGKPIPVEISETLGKPWVSLVE